MSSCIYFLKDNKFLYKYRSAFQNNEDFYLSYCNGNIVKTIDKRFLNVLELIDLQKAFETINPDILLLMFNTTGFQEEKIAQFKFYQSHRTFLVTAILSLLKFFYILIICLKLSSLTYFCMLVIPAWMFSRLKTKIDFASLFHLFVNEHLCLFW